MLFFFFYLFVLKSALSPKKSEMERGLSWSLAYCSSGLMLTSFSKHTAIHWTFFISIVTCQMATCDSDLMGELPSVPDKCKGCVWRPLNETASHCYLLLRLTGMWQAGLKSVAKSREGEFSFYYNQILCDFVADGSVCCVDCTSLHFCKLVYNPVQMQIVWNEALIIVFWPCNLDASDSLAEKSSSSRYWRSSSLLLSCKQGRQTQKQGRAHVLRHFIDFRIRFWRWEI